MAKKTKTDDYMPSETDLAIDRSVRKEKSIPKFELEDWIGYVPHLYKIDSIHLWGDHFRVNVWCARDVPNHLYQKYNIEKSFHVVYKDGEFEDRSNPVRNFDTRIL